MLCMNNKDYFNKKNSLIVRKDEGYLCLILKCT